MNKIKLNQVETQIQKILLLVSKSISESDASKAEPQLRIAGGWVRGLVFVASKFLALDKLLGHESNDIDIAIDNMNGEPFARAVKEYMSNNGLHMSQVEEQLFKRINHHSRFQKFK